MIWWIFWQYLKKKPVCYDWICNLPDFAFCQGHIGMIWRLVWECWKAFLGAKRCLSFTPNFAIRWGQGAVKFFVNVRFWHASSNRVGSTRFFTAYTSFSESSWLCVSFFETIEISLLLVRKDDLLKKFQIKFLGKSFPFPFKRPSGKF